MINFNKIPSGGLPLSGSIKRLIIGDDNVLHDVVWQIFVIQLSNDFSVKFVGSGLLSRNCDLCLHPVSIPINVNSDFIASRDSSLMSGGTYTVNKMDLDVIFMQDMYLKEEDIIKEQFRLQIPLRILCSEICKGLCCYCGNNLNKDSCSCIFESQAQLGSIGKVLYSLK